MNEKVVHAIRSSYIIASSKVLSCLQYTIWGSFRIRILGYEILIKVNYQPQGRQGKLATVRDLKTDVSSVSPSSE